MKPSLKTSACGTIRAVAVFTVGSTASFPSVAVASEAMPAAQQNALVQKYCAVCHTDASKDGGLSLQLTCYLDTHDAEMQLSWAPSNAQKASVMSGAVDGTASFEYNLTGAKSEKMGNGVEAANGPAAIVLYGTKEQSGTNLVTSLPLQTLTISNVFPNHRVVFPFGDLTQTARQTLSTCFPQSS